MSRHLALSDGLFLGSSSAVNLVACVRLARKWNALAELEGGVGGGVGTGTAVGAGGGGERKRIVTILCDSGARHTSRFWYVPFPFLFSFSPSLALPSASLSSTASSY